MQSNRSIYTFGGTVQAGDGLYIVRAADQELLTCCRNSDYAYVLTARQMGKSSLMVQTAFTLWEEGIYAVIHDLSKVGAATPSQWYQSLLDSIVMELGLMCDVSSWWEQHGHISEADRIGRFFREVLLQEITGNIVIFLDEIDSTLSLDFTDDFFATLRALYNSRATEPILKRLSFVLVGVAQPSDLMKDARRTPFNIGRHIDLTDFTLKEAKPLANGLPGDGNEKVQSLEHVFYWTGGHPYLTQKLCYALTRHTGSEQLNQRVKQIIDDNLFGENSYKDSNIQFVRDMLTHQRPNLDNNLLLRTYNAIRADQVLVHDDEKSQVKSHLKLSGIVKRKGKYLVVRNRAYEKIFNAVWVKEVWTASWWELMPRAVKISTAISTLLLITSIILAMIADDQSKQTSNAFATTTYASSILSTVEANVSTFEVDVTQAFEDRATEQMIRGTAEVNLNHIYATSTTAVRELKTVVSARLSLTQEARRSNIAATQTVAAMEAERSDPQPLARNTIEAELTQIYTTSTAAIRQVKTETFEILSMTQDAWRTRIHATENAYETEAVRSDSQP